MVKTKTNQLERVDIRGMNIDDKAIAAIIDGQRIELTTTACNYGKARYWFVCPYCKGRKATLYFGNSGLACRKCYRLAYPIENENRTDRAVRQAWKIRNQLGWRVGGLGDFGGSKPKGMHSKKFYELVAREQDYAMLALQGFFEYFERRFKISVDSF